MYHLFPFLCPFADCDLKDMMWPNDLEWEHHLNDRHPIPNPQADDAQRYTFTCKICLQTFFGERHREIHIIRTSHYAGHMERIASAVVIDYGPGTSASPRRRNSKKRFKPSKLRRRVGYRAGSASSHDSSSSGPDEEAMSGWSSEGSVDSQG